MVVVVEMIIINLCKIHFDYYFSDAFEVIDLILCSL